MAFVSLRAEVGSSIARCVRNAGDQREIKTQQKTKILKGECTDLEAGQAGRTQCYQAMLTHPQSPHYLRCSEAGACDCHVTNWCRRPAARREDERAIVHVQA